MSENTIKLAFYGMPGVELEDIAGSDISAGMLLMQEPGGLISPNTITAYSTGWVAVEEPYTGGYQKTLDQANYYESGDRVYYIKARPGDMMWMWLVTGDSVVEGAPVYPSTTAGYLDSAGVAEAIVGFAAEEVTGGAAPLRVKVQMK